MKARYKRLHRHPPKAIAGSQCRAGSCRHPFQGQYNFGGRSIAFAVEKPHPSTQLLYGGIGEEQSKSASLLFGGEEKIAALEENTVLAVKVNGREIQQGDEIPKGSKVTFVVGDGYGNQRIDVPNVVGMAQDEADILLSGLGLSLGNIIYEVSDKPAGTVFKQQPSAGIDEKIKIGTPVNIWVSGDGSGNTIEN